MQITLRTALRGLLLTRRQGNKPVHVFGACTSLRLTSELWSGGRDSTKTSRVANQKSGIVSPPRRNCDRACMPWHQSGFLYIFVLVGDKSVYFMANLIRHHTNQNLAARKRAYCVCKLRVPPPRCLAWHRTILAVQCAVGLPMTIPRVGFHPRIKKATFQMTADLWRRAP